jgi:hypothetical protein
MGKAKIYYNSELMIISLNFGLMNLASINIPIIFENEVGPVIYKNK